MTPRRHEHQRDHLFVSYASEDATFAQWLTLRLSAAGYKVWCDHIKLLGGESYPIDIDDAIKNRTFRLLAIMSTSALHKPNPLKERTLALNLQQARREEFVIPLNLDGLRADELDWMTSDITFVPFASGWARGLVALVKKLVSVDAPRRADDGAAAVAAWVASQDVLAQREERLWTNVLDCLELPSQVCRVASSDPRVFRTLKQLPHVRINERELYVFELPHDIASSQSLLTEGFAWREDDPLRGVAVQLLRQYLLCRCRERGLVHDDVSRRTYFPDGLLKNNRLSFAAGTRSSWTSVVGHKTFYSAGTRQRTKYHLAPELVPYLRTPGRESVLLKLRVHLTDEEGNRLPEAVRFRRERGLRATWWNDAWLRRMQAIVFWLSEGLPEIDLSLTGSGHIIVSGHLRTHNVAVGIDEDGMLAEEGEEPELIQDETPPLAVEGDADHA